MIYSRFDSIWTEKRTFKISILKCMCNSSQRVPFTLPYKYMVTHNSALLGNFIHELWWWLVAWSHNCLEESHTCRYKSCLAFVKLRFPFDNEQEFYQFFGGAWPPQMLQYNQAWHHNFNLFLFSLILFVRPFFSLYSILHGWIKCTAHSIFTI